MNELNEKEVKTIINDIRNSQFLLDGKDYTINEFLSEHLISKKQREKWSSYKKFCLFASCLLLRNQSGTIIINNEEHYKSNLLLEKIIAIYPTIESNWEKDILFNLIEESGYSSYKKTAPNVLVQAKKIFIEEYNSDFNYYLTLAEKNVENHFKEDYILEINGVGFKTRDLGISCFSDNYLSVDRHLLNVTLEIGLSKFSNIEEAIWKKDCPGNDEEYFRVSNFLIKIAEISDISPYYLDRLLWNYGKRVLNK